MNQRKKAVLKILGICGFGFILALMFFLHANIRLSRDDFFYYPFLKHGMTEFFNRLKLHYQNTNGRLLVHSVCAAFLNYNLWTFRLFNIASILLFSWLLANLFEQDVNRRAGMFLTALSGFWLMGGFTAAEAVTWVSGSFNYILPALLLISYLYFLTNATNAKGYLLAFVLCLLSSVTTEITSALTLLLSIVLLFSSHKKNSLIPPFFLANMLAALAGFLFLVCSPGMHTRTAAVSSLAQAMKQMLIHFTTFSQMCWEPGGIGGMLIFSAISCGICAYKTLKRKLLSGTMFFIAAMAVLTNLGVVYSARCYIVFDLCYFAALIWFGVLLCRQGETKVLLAAICFAAAFAIMCASGMVGFRMLFLPAMCLLVIGLCALSLAQLSLGAISVGCAIMVVVSGVQVLCLAKINQKNAAVWDENQKTIERYDGGALALQSVPDEFYFQGGVPVDNNFGHDYLAEFGIDDEVQSYAVEKQYYTAIDGQNAVVTDKVIRRYDDYYISFERLAEYLNEPHAWRYETSEIRYRGELYRFHYGARSVLTSYVGGRSQKLSAPVRIVDSDLKISVSDANRLFHLNLTIK
ncbi:MAG TPA: hypothetical protein DD391_09650 [Clostridiales bacterium]|nr:hypothetical protein [Clostridiales bacterium]